MKKRRRGLQGLLARSRPSNRMLAGIGRHELSFLAAMGLIGAAGRGFMSLADHVVAGRSHAFDEKLLLKLRNPKDRTDPLGPGWVEEMGRDFTALGGIAIQTLLTVSVAGFLALQRKRHAAALVIVATGGGILLSLRLKSEYQRPRPTLVPHGSIVYTASFPSGHAMVSAITYLTLGALLARLEPGLRFKAFALGGAATLTVLVGTSRVYLGVHWPTDVLAGWSAGAAWAAACWSVARLLQRKGQVERDRPLLGLVSGPSARLHPRVRPRPKQHARSLR